MKKTAPSIVAVAALALALGGCASDTGNASGEGGDADEFGTLTMGVINNNPPFEYEEGGDLVGFDVELVEAILEAEGLEGDWKTMEFGGLIPAIQADQIDIAVSHVSITEERKEVVDFTDAYFTDGQSVAVAPDSGIEKLEDLEGKTIVATQGSVGQIAANEAADKYGATVQNVSKTDQLWLAVTSGQADAFILETSAINFRISQEGDAPSVRMLEPMVFEAPIGIAVSKGNEALVERLNAGLEKIRENGAYDDLVKKYLD